MMQKISIHVFLPCYFSRDKSLSPSGAFVIEEDPITCVHVVSLAIVYHRPEIEL